MDITSSFACPADQTPEHVGEDQVDDQVEGSRLRVVWIARGSEDYRLSAAFDCQDDDYHEEYRDEEICDDDEADRDHPPELGALLLFVSSRTVERTPSLKA